MLQAGIENRSRQEKRKGETGGVAGKPGAIKRHRLSLKYFDEAADESQSGAKRKSLSQEEPKEYPKK